MTPNEMQFLSAGVLIGAYAMVFLNWWLDLRIIKQDLARSVEARRRAAGARFLAEVRISRLRYEMQQRSRA
jgi:hypothetical protein